MADFKFKCPFCGQKLSADEEWRGERTECPKCHLQFDVPTEPQTTPRPKKPRNRSASPTPQPKSRSRNKGAGVLPKREKKTKRQEKEPSWFVRCLILLLSVISMIFTKIKSGKFWTILFWVYIFSVFIYLGIAWMVTKGCSNASQPKIDPASAPASVAEKKPGTKKSEPTVTVKLDLYDNGNNRINPMFGIWVHCDKKFIYEAQRHIEELSKAYGKVSMASDDNKKILAEMDVTAAKHDLITYCIRNCDKAVVFKERERSGSYTFRLDHGDRLLSDGGRCFIYLEIKYYNKDYYVFKLINLDGVDKTLEITNDDLLSY